jgi:hypothetical protein
MVSIDGMVPIDGSTKVLQWCRSSVPFGSWKEKKKKQKNLLPPPLFPPKAESKKSLFVFQSPMVPPAMGVVVQT